MMRYIITVPTMKIPTITHNFNKEAKKMQIPEGNYTVACCNGVINEEGLGFVSGKEVEVAPQSALILYQK